MRLSRTRLLLYVLFASLVAIAIMRMLAQPDVPMGSVLAIDLEGEYVEGAQTPWSARLRGERKRTFLGLLETLAKAERDERLAAVLFRVRPLEIGWAKAQEIRDAIFRLRDAGRHTIAYFEVERIGANLEYYVASAADELYLTPGTTAPLVGLAAEYYFLGGLWQKLGISVDVEQSGEFKSAAEFYAAEKMSDPARAMSNALLDSVDAQFVSGIAEARGLETRAVREAIDAAPADPALLVAARLAEGVAFYDEILEQLGDPDVVDDALYSRVTPESVGIRPAARFALVYATGPVVMGEGDASLSGESLIASDTLSEALEAASTAEDVRAIILRVDSPGGSPLASDLIWRATQRARDSGKPLVASFSDLAASGGYYIACGADVIVAQPASLTGSIGAFVLRPSLGGFLQKLGIGFEAMTRAPRADLLLSSQPLSPAARELLRSEVAGVYELFVERVAEGRDLDPADVHDVARGRVWTGVQAAERGLVDELGGLEVAINRAKQLAGLDSEADVELRVYPAPLTLAARLGRALQAQAWVAPVVLPLPKALRDLERWLAAAPPRSPVVLPPFVPEIR